MSAVATKFEFVPVSYPPATSTVPLGSSAATWYERRLLKLAVACQASATGS